MGTQGGSDDGDIRGTEHGEVDLAGLATDMLIWYPLVDLGLDGLSELLVMGADLVGPLGIESKQVGKAKGLAFELVGD